jgi:VanZ family protein
VTGVREGAALVLHLFTFAALGTLDRLGFKETVETTAIMVPALARSILCCIAIELAQAFTPSRHAELLDLAVNITGVALGHLAVLSAR